VFSSVDDVMFWCALECTRDVVECSKLLCSDALRYCAEYINSVQVWHRQIGLSPMSYDLDPSTCSWFLDPVTLDS
jgi:hypothetical protein